MNEDRGMNGACVWVGVLGWLASSAALASTTVEPPALPGVRDEAEPEPPAQTEPVEEPTEVEPPDQAEPVEEPTEAQPTEPEPTPEPEPEPEPEPTGETDPFAGGAAATPPPQPTSSPAAAPTASPAPASSAPVQRPTPAATTTTREPTPSAEPEPREAAEDESDPPRESEDEGEEEDKEPIKHRGFIIDFRAGVVGCTKPICKRHRARPGLRLDGMLGRNILGFVDIGLAGAWGTMGTRVDPGTDGLALYGLDPATLPPEAALLMFDQFTVDSARLETIQAGLDLRVHILPRGRFDPYVGVGAQYSLFRGVYGTPAGRTKLGFHGLAFPLQVGFVVFATRRIAFGAQFDWLWSWYGGVTVRGAPGRFAAPIPAISEAAAMAGVKLPGDLPNLWSVGGVVHLRLGKPK